MLKNKTVRKRFISKILSLLTLFVVVSAPALFAAVASCTGNTGTSGTRYGTINGTCYAYYCKDETMTKLGGVNSSQCTNCSGVKYAPSGNCGTCEYKCCSDGNWSGCNQACPDPSAACSSSQCWNGSKCADKPASGLQYNGKCYFKWTNCSCNKGTGWNCTQTPADIQDGSWSAQTSKLFTTNSGLCSTKVDISENAVLSCRRQGASVRGIPLERMGDGEVTHTGECFKVISCKCNNTGKTITADQLSNLRTHCWGSGSSDATCTGKTLTCSSHKSPC